MASRLPRSNPRPRSPAAALLADWVVAVGASGVAGLDDIKLLLACLRPDIPAIVMVVLHRQWGHISVLRDILSRGSAMPVLIPSHGEMARRSTAYIGEPGVHLVLAADRRMGMIDDSRRQYRNGTVDLLFDSVAEHGGRRTIGVVLSGALQDGAQGLAAIRRGGGLTMVRTPNSGPRDGMPENAISFGGKPDFVTGPAELAVAIDSTVRHRRRGGGGSVRVAAG